MEQYCTLLRALHLLFKNARRTHQKAATSFAEILRGDFKNQSAKCAFFQTKVQFLGLVISKNGLEADPEKFKAVQNFLVPQNQTDVKSFLGLCSHYRRYFENFGMIARPLHKASETNSSFTWTEETQETIESLEKHLTSTSFLTFPNIEEPLILYIDPTLTAMLAVLAQVHDGKT